MMKAREAAGWLLVHVLTATWANTTGHPEVLSVDVATSAEDSAGWLEFPTSDLTVRGLCGVRLINSDTHFGLVAALGAKLVKRLCRSHYLLN
jgi:transposase-like protein